MASIFICYRREDSIANAGRLYDRLVEVFGAEHRVFMDIDGIQPGEDFVDKLEETIGSCDAMLVVIGKHWLTAASEEKLVRLQDPEDYVRLEILAGLRRRIRVIPVLVSGARMPRSQDLPKDIEQLARRQALELNDANFRQTLAPLIAALERIVADSPKPANLGFDGAVEEGLPRGWSNSVEFVDGVSADYDIRVVAREHSSGQCLKLSKHATRPGEFGSVMQRFSANFLAGRTVKLEGELRTERVVDWAGLWLRADGEKLPNLFFDNMSGRGLSGTTAWKKYSIEAQLPPATVWLNFGVVLSGSGAVWADNLRLTVWNPKGYWVDV